MRSVSYLVEPLVVYLTCGLLTMVPCRQYFFNYAWMSNFVVRHLPKTSKIIGIRFFMMQSSQQ